MFFIIAPQANSHDKRLAWSGQNKIIYLCGEVILKYTVGLGPFFEPLIHLLPGFSMGRSLREILGTCLCDEIVDWTWSARAGRGRETTRNAESISTRGLAGCLVGLLELGPDGDCTRSCNPMSEFMFCFYSII